MRSGYALTAGVFATACVATVSLAARSAQVAAPTGLVEAAQSAIGAHTSTESVGALRIEGTVRAYFSAATGQLRQPEPLTILVLLPDYYLRESRNPVGIVMRQGFAGRESLFRITSPPGWSGDGAARSGVSTAGARRDLARLMLGMLAETERAGRLAVTAVGRSAFSATFADGSGQDADLSRMMVLLDPVRLPIRIREHDRLTFPRLLTDAERRAGSTRLWTQPEEVEVTYDFGDRRSVAGLLLPHRLTKSARGVIFEEMRFQRIEVNPPLTARDFAR